MSKMRLLVVSLTDHVQGPAMAAVLRKVLPRRFSNIKWEVESAAMIKFHAGKKTDSRMVTALKESGYDDKHHVTRVLDYDDLEKFDYFLPIDAQSRSFLHLKVMNAPIQPTILRAIQIQNPQYVKDKTGYKDCIRTCERAALTVL